MGEVTKSYSPSAAARKRGANFEVVYEDGDKADNRLFASTYDFGPDAEYGAWVFLEKKGSLTSTRARKAAPKAKKTGVSYHWTHAKICRHMNCKRF